MSSEHHPTPSSATRKRLSLSTERRDAIAHDLARREMGLATLIPPDSGRPRKDGRPPGGRWRNLMKRLLATRESRKRCGYTHRWQSETVHSMMKRNLGSALRGKTAHSRKRDLRLKAITHDLMVV